MPMEISSVANDGGPHSGFAASPLWSPSPARVASSQMEEFRQRMAGKYSVPLKSYQDLWAWSTRHISTFWRETWIFTEILHSHPPTMVKWPIAGGRAIGGWLGCRAPGLPFPAHRTTDAWILVH